ncbi:MFS transporter [Hathewaya limosa]|uniref:Fucose permease n=1 Tax=Hathewaya limosa TaxID=1536 RepID=A0ABU0JXM9_HATLI|nr:MFS transporter [Hathewaya limosa]MDQ0481016.1 fucose permease [Hathewaya limosa]
MVTPNSKKKCNKNKYIYLIIFMFALMILDAIAENIKGVFVPIFKSTLNINDSVIGIWLFVGSFAYIIFTYLGGLFSRKVGQKKVFISGMLFAILATFLFSITKSMGMLFVDTFLINAALALCAIAINTLIPFIAVSFQAVLMNLTHFFYGFGATIGTSSAGYLLNKNISWQKIYLGVTVLYIVMMGIFYFIKVPEVSINKETNSSNKLELNKTLVYAFGIALGFYVFAESATVTWFVNYMEKGFNLGIGSATKYLSAFTAVFTIGRLLGGFVVEKFGELRSVIVSTVIAIILFVTGIILAEKGLMFIAASGLFFAITFPTIVLASSKVFKSDSSYVMGLIVSSASVVSMILNAILGSLNQAFGPSRAFFIIPISLFISLCAQFYINNSLRKN